VHLYVSVCVNQFTQRKATTGGGNLRNVTHPVDSALALCTLCFCHCMRECVCVCVRGFGRVVCDRWRIVSAGCVLWGYWYASLSPVCRSNVHMFVVPLIHVLLCSGTGRRIIPFYFCGSFMLLLYFSLPFYLSFYFVQRCYTDRPKE